MLQSETSGGVATLRLDRRDRGNALSVEMVQALQQAVASAIADPAVHTLAFAGSGPHFCTGFDLSDLEAETDATLAVRFVALERLLQAVWYAPLRTVALAQGRAWGAGADLFASCDVRGVRADCTLRFPGSAFGIVLGTRRLVEAIGWDRARAFVTEGASCDAAGALALGLASEIVDGDEGDWWARRTAPAAVDRETLAAIRAATRPDHRDEDFATLRASAQRVGLQARIAAYRDRLRKR